MFDYKGAQQVFMFLEAGITLLYYLDYRPTMNRRYI
jgi:hypothetical protein